MRILVIVAVLALFACSASAGRKKKKTPAPLEQVKNALDTINKTCFGNFSLDDLAARLNVQDFLIEKEEEDKGDDATQTAGKQKKKNNECVPKTVARAVRILKELAKNVKNDLESACVLPPQQDELRAEQIMKNLIETMTTDCNGRGDFNAKVLMHRLQLAMEKEDDGEDDSDDSGPPSAAKNNKKNDCNVEPTALGVLRKMKEHIDNDTAEACVMPEDRNKDVNLERVRAALEGINKMCSGNFTLEELQERLHLDDFIEDEEDGRPENGTDPQPPPQQAKGGNRGKKGKNKGKPECIPQTVARAARILIELYEGVLSDGNAGCVLPEQQWDVRPVQMINAKLDWLNESCYGVGDFDVELLELRLELGEELSEGEEEAEEEEEQGPPGGMTAGQSNNKGNRNKKGNNKKKNGGGNDCNKWPGALAAANVTLNMMKEHVKNDTDQKCVMPEETDPGRIIEGAIDLINETCGHEFFINLTVVLEIDDILGWNDELGDREGNDTDDGGRGPGNNGPQSLKNNRNKKKNGNEDEVSKRVKYVVEAIQDILTTIEDGTPQEACVLPDPFKEQKKKKKCRGNKCKRRG